ncbi:hypothetical protein KFK09_003091 [Dendrobium nobile]|uniref:Retrovirus-related Pol polyprotein from transposon TNT 1-94 n=1 Tax=Dendrobium nobile TaxID=94219 RepID=A0A8T3C861_DENNO|nr:hypothetical protein KFK09_003091 [Dendrobium nobile]
MTDPNSATQSRTTSTLSSSMANIVIPPALKFLMSNLKLIVHTQLTTDNYTIWRLQIHQTFAANGFERYIAGTIPCPSESSAEDHKLWKLIDQNLISALFSTISPSVLPYILHLKTSREIWQALELRLQPTNRSRIIQLKNELHNVQMRDQSVAQYLGKVKSLVDNIAAAGGYVDTEDIILYTLKGLPASFNPFKAAIRISPLPVTLESLYSLLCSEEINLQTEIHQENPITSEQ